MKSMKNSLDIPGPALVGCTHPADAEDFDQLGLRGARSGRGRGESLAALVALSQRVVLLSKASHFNGAIIVFFKVNVE